MKYGEKYDNTWYAALTVPKEVRPVIGHARYYKSTETGIESEALPIVVLLVTGWKAEIAKARGKIPNTKAATLFENLRRQYLETTDEGTRIAIEDAAETALLKVADLEEASTLWMLTTGQSTPLASLVTDWKGSLKLAQKTIDQRHRDVSGMADHFVNLEALQPKRVKVWTDKLIAEGATAATLERLMNGCRSFWQYLQDSGTLDIDAPNPFVGSFRLATRRAKRNTVNRRAFTPTEVADTYRQALADGDTALAHLIALGAYSGARIEELCSLTKETSVDGLFTITDAKTDAGIRQVPIHPALVSLVKSLREASKDGYLIPSAAAGKYGVRSDPLSKRFGRMKTAMGFGPGHVFHSIRKTVSTQLEQAGVAEGITMDILGHEKKTMSYGTYSEGTSTKQKLKAIAKVAYPAPLNKS